MSFVCLFDFHDVIYHVQHCNVDNGQRNIILQLLDVKTRISVQTRVIGNSNAPFKMAFKSHYIL